MRVRVYTWSGGRSTPQFEEDVNWGTDTLKYKSTVQSIVEAALASYSPGSAVSAVIIDISDPVLESRVFEDKIIERGDRKLDQLW